MVAFRQKDAAKLTRILNDADYARSMNLGDCTLMNDVLQVDLRGDYPEFTSRQATLIAMEGFERADTFWYEIAPAPQNQHQRAQLLVAFQTLPSTTIAPVADTPVLQVSFTKALSHEQIAAVHNTTDMKIRSIPTVPLQVSIF